MTELNGTLDGLGLPAIVRFLASLNKTGWLRVGHEDWRGDVFFDQGSVVFATLGSRQGLPALEALVQSLPEVQFTFSSALPPPSTWNVDLYPEALQARLDELAARAVSGQPSLPSLLAVPRLVPQDEAGGADQLRLDRGSVQTLLAIDGRRTVRDIVSARGSFEALWQLAKLADAGLIQLQPAPAEPAPGEPAPSEPAPRESVGRVAAASQADRGAVAEKLAWPDVEPAPKTAEPTVRAVPGVGAPSPVLPADQAVTMEPPGTVEPAASIGPPPTIEPAVTVEPSPRAAVLEPPTPQPEPRTAIVRCPKLGFVDDPARAFDLPTRLHRCYAFSAPLPLTVEQQRELCLSGRYTSCTRFVDASRGRSVRLPTPSTDEALRSAGAELGVAAAARPWLSRAEIAQPRPVVERLSRALPVIGLVTLLLAILGLLLVPRLVETPEEPPDLAATAVALQGARGGQQPQGPAQPQATSQPQGLSSATQRQANSDVRSSMAAQALPTGLGFARVLLDERFAINERGWPDDPQGPAVLSSGAYRVTTSQPGLFVALAAPLTDVVQDVLVGATFHKLGGPAGGGFGLIVRDQGPPPRDGINQSGRYYVLEVGDKGEFGMWRREDDRWVDLVPWQASSAVRPGTATNEIAVKAIGDQLTLVVNGTEVASYTETTLPAGRLGLFVGGDQNQVAVEHFWVQAP